MGAAAITNAVLHPLLASYFGGWEIVLVLAVVLILFTAKGLPGFVDQFLRGWDELKKIMNRRSETPRPVQTEATDQKQSLDRSSLSRTQELILWVAQGFDLGRIPWAPGTFGSLLGLLWFLVLLVPASLPLYVTGILLGMGVSVWLCGAAEKILGQTDPGSVVLDEMVVLPICFLPWVCLENLRGGAMPPAELFLGPGNWWRTALVFVLFRCFDILKPWPVRQSQSLPGGWGVTIDDVLAACYVALISWLWLP